jgi:DNA-3-methyladenine glycosylase I
VAAIGNARATLRLWEQGISLAASRDLRRRGFRFVGPTTVYAAMQSLGVVNDHLDGCESWAACDDDRRAFIRPR